MADLAALAALLSGTAIFLPALQRGMPDRDQQTEILCRTGTRIMSDEELDRTALKLVRAGLDMNAAYFGGVKALMAGMYLLICVFLLFFSTMAFFLMPGVILFYMLPELWIDFRIRKRQEHIKLNMGDFSIMMATALTAGINPIPALQEAASACGGILGDEISRFIMDVLSGKNFSMALIDLVHRTDVDELTNFTRTLEQIYIQGAPGAETMRIYSDQMRIARKFETMDRAGKLSVQLIFPVMILILVPILLAIGYPAVYALVNAF